MVWPAIIAAGASLASSALGAYGQSKTNKANLDMARENRDFQERMSSSAYQRSMKDMRKAGLNPILAYKQGGASTPSGTTIAAQNPYANMNLGGAVSSAMSARQTNAQTDLTRNEAEIKRNQWNTSAAEAYEAIMKKRLLRDPDYQRVWTAGQYMNALGGGANAAFGASAMGLRNLLKRKGVPRTTFAQNTKKYDRSVKTTPLPPPGKAKKMGIKTRKYPQSTLKGSDYDIRRLNPL
jgi:hypothetical protein